MGRGAAARNRLLSESSEICDAMVCVKKTERIYFHTESSAKIALSIVQAVHKIRQRRKRPDKISVTDSVAMEHGLSKSEITRMFDQLLDNGIFQTKSIRGVDSLFVEKSKEHDFIESLMPKNNPHENKDDEGCQILSPAVATDMSKSAAELNDNITAESHLL